MPRQPFLPTYAKARHRFPANALAERPKIAAAIGECVVMWTYVEVQMAIVLSAIMKANSEPVIAVFLSMRNARAQRDAINAAAEVGLTDELLEVYEAISNVYKGLEAQRNDLAHGLFGISDDIPDHILWMESKTHTNFFVQWIAKLSTPEEISVDSVKKDLFVYKLSDITTLRDQILELWRAALLFGSHLRNIEQFPSILMTDEYGQLCALPQIQQELSRLRSVQQNNPQSQPSPQQSGPIG